MSYRNDNDAGYDRTLLSSVPDPTRAEKQVRGPQLCAILSILPIPVSRISKLTESCHDLPFFPLSFPLFYLHTYPSLARFPRPPIYNSVLAIRSFSFSFSVAFSQEGYNVDLLDEGRDRRGTTPSNDLAPTSDHQHGPTVGYSPGAVSYARKEEVASNGLEPVIPKVPWYRTRRGVIFIVIGVVLIIAAIVGGAVGGTHHSSHHTTPSNASSSVSGNNSATGVQGTGNVTQQSQQSVGAGPNTVNPSPSSSAKRSLLEIML